MKVSDERREDHLEARDHAGGGGVGRDSQGADDNSTLSSWRGV